MNKLLLIVRHAQAEQTNNVQKDFERELTTTGFADASRMGRFLSSKKIKPTAVFSSPAHRARTTAQLMAEQLGFDFTSIVLDQEIYESSVRKLMQLINGLDESLTQVMLVGHNPHLSYLAEYLTQYELGDLPACGVVAINFERQAWKEASNGTGKFTWLEYPEKIPVV
jgi:phosphohistidine phosphatase